MHFLGVTWLFACVVALVQDWLPMKRLFDRVTIWKDGCEKRPSDAYLETIHGTFSNCQTGLTRQLFLGVYLTIGNFLALAQWLVVMALTQEHTVSLSGPALGSVPGRTFVLSFVQQWEFTALAVTLFVVCWNITGPALVCASSCNIGINTIILSCWSLVIMTSIASAFLKASIFETFLVFIPCSINMGASIGLLWHGQRNVHQRRGYERIQYVDKSPLTAGTNTN